VVGLRKLSGSIMHQVAGANQGMAISCCHSSALAPAVAFETCRTVILEAYRQLGSRCRRMCGGLHKSIWKPLLDVLPEMATGHGRAIHLLSGRRDVDGVEDGVEDGVDMFSGAARS
jgi:hypothetical protein